MEAISKVISSLPEGSQFYSWLFLAVVAVFYQIWKTHLSVSAKLEAHKRELELLKLALELEQSLPSGKTNDFNSITASTLQRCAQTLRKQTGSESRSSIVKLLGAHFFRKNWKTVLARFAIGNVGLVCWGFVIFGYMLIKTPPQTTEEVTGIVIGILTIIFISAVFTSTLALFDIFENHWWRLSFCATITPAVTVISAHIFHWIASVGVVLMNAQAR